MRTNDAVHQRRLPGARGADQGDEHRRGRAAHPGQQVVVDLAKELAAFGLDLSGSGDLEDEGDGGDPLPEVEQGGLEQARVDPDVRLGSGPGPGRGDGLGLGRGGLGIRDGLGCGDGLGLGRGGLGTRDGLGCGDGLRLGRGGLGTGDGLGGLGWHGRELHGHGFGGPGPHDFGLGPDGLRLGGLGLGGLALGGLALGGLGGRIPDGLGSLGRHGRELHRLGLAAVGRHGAGRHRDDRGRGLGRRGGREGISRGGIYRGCVCHGRREAGRGLVVARILIPCDSVIVSIGINNVIQFVRFNLPRRQFRLRPPV